MTTETHSRRYSWDSSQVPNATTYHTAIVVAMHGKRLSDALSFLEEMKAQGFRPDVSCYNAIVSACARCGEPEKAFSVVSEMRGAGLRPNTRTYSSLLNACASAGLVDKAEEVVVSLRSEGHLVDEYVLAGLVDCLSVAHVREFPDVAAEGAAQAREEALRECAQLAEASRALPEPLNSSRGRPQGLPRVVFNALLGAHVAMGDYPGAVSLFNAAQNQEGLKPSASTYQHAIAATLRCASGDLGSVAALNAAMALYESALAQDVQHSLGTRRELVNFATAMPLSPGSPALAAAVRLLSEYTAGAGFVNVPDGSAWMLRLAKPKLGAQGLLAGEAIWNSLGSRGRTPNPEAMTAYLAALQAAGDTHQARTVRRAISVFGSQSQRRQRGRGDEEGAAGAAQDEGDTDSSEEARA